MQDLLTLARREVSTKEVVTVSDTGVDMSAKEMERISELFYTKKVMGRSGAGLGIAVAVAWGTVKDHNGYIDMKSTEGKARSPRLADSHGGGEPPSPSTFRQREKI